MAQAGEAFTERIEQYSLKAAREAKERTSWANNHAEYEGALHEFVRTILDRGVENQFLLDFEDFERRIARIGFHNSLAQCLLKMTAPGVPDIYQGNELLQFRLVDPDNRQPVDYERRRQLLDQFLRNGDAQYPLANRIRDLVTSTDNDAVKVYLTWKTLTIRKAKTPLFQRGRYVSIKARRMERSQHTSWRLLVNMMGRLRSSPCRVFPPSFSARVSTTFALQRYGARQSWRFREAGQNAFITHSRVNAFR